MIDELKLTDIKRLVVNDGDTLVLTYPQSLSQEQRSLIVDQLSRIIKAKFTVLILDAGMKIDSVING